MSIQQPQPDHVAPKLTTHAPAYALLRAARLTLALLALSLPYEFVLFRAGSLDFTNLELLLASLLLLTTVLVLRQRRWRVAGWLRVPRTWLILWLLFAVALLLSAFLAPTHRLNALKASARLLAGMALALSIPQLLPLPGPARRQSQQWLILPLIAGGLPVAIIGLLEVWQRAPFAWLDAVRRAPTYAGPFVRLTGVFEHANQAAMFFEATAPLLLAAALILYRHKRRRRTVLLLIVPLLLLWLQAIIAAYSRTAVAALLIATLAVALLRAAAPIIRRAPNSAPARPWALLAAALLALLALNTLLDPVVRLRLQTEGDNEWYNVRFEAPDVLQLTAGQTVTTTVTVHNQGHLRWVSAAPYPIFLAGRWFVSTPGNAAALAHAPRWTLPHAVAPGQSLTMRVPLSAPMQAGDYQLRWDVIHEGKTWFSYKNGDRTTTAVVVNPAPNTAEQSARAAPTAPEQAALARLVPPPPDPAPIPPRGQLWRIAAAQLSQRPLLGIGLDNFRLTYGQHLDYEQWNDTIHTNNWYLEMLVSLGLPGALFHFLWLGLLLVALLRTLWQAPRRPAHFATATLQTALAVSLLAYLLHGLLDYFLAANPTGLLFWLLVGWWLALAGESAAQPQQAAEA